MTGVDPSGSVGARAVDAATAGGAAQRGDEAGAAEEAPAVAADEGEHRSGACDHCRHHYTSCSFPAASQACACCGGASSPTDA